MRLGDAIGLVCASPANPDCNRRLDLFVTRRERRDDDEVWFCECETRTLPVSIASSDLKQ